MKLVLGISVLCIVTLLSSCVKDNSADQPVLIKDVVIANGCEIFYTYDAFDRCISITQCDTLETFTYSHDTVVDLRMSGAMLIYKNVYKLNSTGLAVSCVSVGPGGPIATYTFTYDAAGHRLTAIDTTISFTTDNYTIQAGDVVSETSASAAILTNNYSISTTFYIGTVNRLSNANFGLSFLGTSSANLKKADNIDIQQGQYTVTYTYTLNNQNGISQQVSTVNGAVVDSRHFDYY